QLGAQLRQAVGELLAVRLELRRLLGRQLAEPLDQLVRDLLHDVQVVPDVLVHPAVLVRVVVLVPGLLVPGLLVLGGLVPGQRERVDDRYVRRLIRQALGERVVAAAVDDSQIRPGERQHALRGRLVRVRVGHRIVDHRRHVNTLPADGARDTGPGTGRRGDRQPITGVARRAVPAPRHGEDGNAGHSRQHRGTRRRAYSIRVVEENGIRYQQRTADE